LPAGRATANPLLSILAPGAVLDTGQELPTRRDQRPAEISYTIGAVLREHGVRATLSRAEEADINDTYDAYVIGSAVYAGHWMKHVRQFVREYSQKLLAAEMIECTAAQDHKIFGGKLDPEKMSFPERAITRALHAPYGDFRDFADVRAWAAQIAEQLSKVEVKS
jgi:menaquinone-dependent protoporphyrinogen oxidase